MANSSIETNSPDETTTIEETTVDCPFYYDEKSNTTYYVVSYAMPMPDNMDTYHAWQHVSYIHNSNKTVVPTYIYQHNGYVLEMGLIMDYSNTPDECYVI